MKTVKYILLLFIYFGVVSSLFGQILWLNFTDRENYYDSIKTHCNYYVDVFPDTVFFNEQIYFFRQSPLSLRKGYTNIFYNEDLLLDVMAYPNHDRTGAKGFHVAWIIRNDSLLIKNIYPDYFYTYVVENGAFQKNDDGSLKMQPSGGYISDDTIVAKFEKFTGNKFRDGLLHVNWITGYFGIITSYIAPFVNENLQKNYDNGHYLDGREGGFIMTFENGKLKKMTKDKRKFKN